MHVQTATLSFPTRSSIPAGIRASSFQGEFGIFSLSSLRKKQVENKKKNSSNTRFSSNPGNRCLSAVACCRGNYLLISQCRFSTTQGKVSPSHHRLRGLGAAGMCPRSPGLLTCSRGPAHAAPSLIGNSGKGLLIPSPAYSSPASRWSVCPFVVMVHFPLSRGGGSVAVEMSG